jgi:hypothetical protein
MKVKNNLRDILTYFYMISHPRVLVKVCREYLEASKMIKKLTEETEQFNRLLRERPGRQDSETRGSTLGIF